MPHSQTDTLNFRSRKGFVLRLTDALVQAAARRRDRRALAKLDPHLLRDIGLSPDEARAECLKPFWQP